MPALDFKGKSLVYSHHLTVPARVLDVAVFATHKFIGRKELTGMGIMFCQLSYCLN